MIKEFINNKYVQILIIIIISFILLKVTNFIFRLIKKHYKNNVYLPFFKGIVKTIIIICAIIKIGSYFYILKQISSTILMSSSLFVVVLGFIFQEGLSNIVHGFIIVIFKPFNVGDKIQITIDNHNISGIVKGINLRHTKIISIIDNAPQIVPNSKLDLSTIKNFSNKQELNKYPIKINITYKDASDFKKRNLAKKIISDAICNNELTIVDDKTKPVFIKVDLLDSSVLLTAWVYTKTYEENFEACSSIAEYILDEFKKNNINLAYPHNEISGTINLLK